MCAVAASTSHRLIVDVAQGHLLLAVQHHQQPMDVVEEAVVVVEEA